ncbi:MAG: hypothetical protein SGARI_005899, partial [Bacillariaceae sp.]
MARISSHQKRAGAALLLFALHQTAGFSILDNNGSLTPALSTHRSGEHTSQTALFAKTKNKKTKKSKKTIASATGGFGKVAATPVSRPKPKADEDYSVFPALDPQVAETLIPAPASLQEESGYLSAEIYDRLDQIYGFSNFNYEELASEDNEEDDEPELSFSDLLAAPSEPIKSTTRAATKSSLSDTDFADLLNAATGGTMESPAVSKSKNSPDAASSSNEVTNLRNDIAKLPPFEKFRVLHVDPLVLAIGGFFTDAECDRYIEISGAETTNNDSQVESFETRSKTVGKDASAKSQRTSTTWFHHYKKVPELMAKASRLVGLDTIAQWEEPQTVRYRPSEKFTWHLDALAPPQATPDL